MPAPMPRRQQRTGKQQSSAGAYSSLTRRRRHSIRLPPWCQGRRRDHHLPGTERARELLLDRWMNVASRPHVIRIGPHRQIVDSSRDVVEAVIHAGGEYYDILRTDAPFLSWRLERRIMKARQVLRFG